jgi:hypothetical protein
MKGTGLGKRACSAGGAKKAWLLAVRPAGGAAGVDTFTPRGEGGRELCVPNHNDVMSWASRA